MPLARLEGASKSCGDAVALLNLCGAMDFPASGQVWLNGLCPPNSRRRALELLEFVEMDEYAPGFRISSPAAKCSALSWCAPQSLFAPCR